MSALSINEDVGLWQLPSNSGMEVGASNHHSSGNIPHRHIPSYVDVNTH
jgi:hypothetical protein